MTGRSRFAFSSWQAVQRWVVTGVSVGTLLAVPGCWDYQSINTRATVLGMAIDPAPNHPDQIQVTAQFAVLHADPSGGGGSGAMMGSQASGSVPFENLTAEAHSITEGMRRLQLNLSRSVDSTQVRCVVFSERLSPLQLQSALQELTRQTQINRAAYVAAVPDSAADLLAQPLSDEAPADAVAKKFGVAVKQYGYYVRRQLWEFWRDSAQLGLSPSLPELTATDAVPSEGKPRVVDVSGLCIYKGARVAARLNRSDTLMFNILSGRVRDMGLDIPVQEGLVSLGDVRVKSRLWTMADGHRVRIVARIRLQGTMARRPDADQMADDPAPLTKMEEQANQYLEQALLSTVRKMQQAGVDPWGFGRFYLHAHPEQSELVKYHWADVFRTATCDTHVRVRIISRGELV